ncbi:MAG: YraN family protein [Candidatus Eisenbacteria bacterium]
MSNVRLGELAERIAVAFLQMKGHAILATNYRFQRHEIDIVSQVDRRIIFVEVKCRSGLRYGLPRQAVGAEKMRRIVRAASGFLVERRLTDRSTRFDVVEVRVEHGGLSLAVEHIVGAFGADMRGW